MNPTERLALSLLHAYRRWMTAKRRLDQRLRRAELDGMCAALAALRMMPSQDDAMVELVLFVRNHPARPHEGKGWVKAARHWDETAAIELARKFSVKVVAA